MGGTMFIIIRMRRRTESFSGRFLSILGITHIGN
uniref:Uncharacterized protein n=2 Tax=unclassified Caudoviricetes TaxID=2788787 RepID=A0A8S5Q8T7_9CAUD|nr:MAG TPA: hypothetical protein [Siphoviridae sp. ctAvK3]DAE15217.1 MAG TPA: hypothetical protein [Siphoviridae sp. ctdVv30]